MFKEGVDQNDIRVLENMLLKIKYKDEKLLSEKLKLMRKNLLLKNEMESIQAGILDMKKMHGLDAFENLPANE